MKRILVLATPTAGLPDAALAASGAEVERRPLPEPTAPPEAWDALVAALLAADVVITD